jgi:hypothetical protein
MKQLLSAFFANLLLCGSLYAQGAFEIKDQNLQVKNFRYETDVYLPDVGTKGIMLIFDYYYTSESKYLASFVQDIKLQKFGIEIFRDSSSYLILRPNQWSVARKFVPYRKINLPEGEHNEIDISIKVPNLLAYKGILKMSQPARYFVNINIQGGAPKPIAGYWDAGSPAEAPADIYWTISSDEGIFTAYESNIAYNSNALPKENAQFYALEGEKLFLNIYDEDGSNDQFLGKYELGLIDADLRKEELGQMFDNIVNLEFSYNQYKLTRQPISTYVRSDVEHKGRKGVELIFEYYLPKALEGRSMKPLIGYKTKEGKVVDIPYIYALNKSVMPGKKMTMPDRGKLSYFIPYYAWNSATQEINFQFADEKDKAEAAPYYIHNPIEFEKFISYAAYSVEDNFNYQGTSGIKISLSYKVKDINTYSTLEINFLNPNGSPALYPIYPIGKNEGLVKALEQNPYIDKNPVEEGSFDFFVPYLDLSSDHIRVEMNMIPDMKIALINENSPKLLIPQKTRDAALVKLKEEAVFKEGDYGFVLSLDCAIPAFYKDRTMLDIKATRDGVPYTGYTVVGDMLNSESKDSIKLTKEKGTVFIIFPYRRLSPKDKIVVTCLLKETNRGIGLSDSIIVAHQLPNKIYNVETVINLDALQFDASIPKTTKDVDWKYVVTVGTEAKINKRLPYSIKGKEVREKFSRSVRIHREDLIQIKLVHKDSAQQVIYLWSGDLGKFQQHKFSNRTKEQSPVKRAKVSVKLDKKQLKTQPAKEPEKN